MRLNIGGAITPGEILLLLLTPFLFKRMRQIAQLRPAKQILMLLAIYLLSNIISDIYRHTPPIDFLRGWSRSLMMGFGFLALGALIGSNEYRILAFILGGTLSNMFADFFGEMRVGIEHSSTTLYKFVFGVPISTFAFILYGWFGSVFWGLPRIAPYFSGALAFLMNSRSLAGITIMAALVQGLFKKQFSISDALKTSNIAKYISVAAGIGAIYIFYVTAAPAGWLGPEAKAKFESQKGSAVGAKFSLTSGRHELAFSWPKIEQSPIIGWGSWAKDPVYVFERCLLMGGSVPQARYVSRVNGGLIPTHSHFFGAWLESGILGAVFWGVMMIKALSIVFTGKLNIMKRLSPVLTFIFMIFLWDVLFSPFGGERRLWNGFLLWLFVLIPLIAARANSLGYNKLTPESAGPMENKPVILAS